LSVGVVQIAFAKCTKRAECAGPFALRVDHWSLNRVLSDNKGDSDRHG